MTPKGTCFTCFPQVTVVHPVFSTRKTSANWNHDRRPRHVWNRKLVSTYTLQYIQLMMIESSKTYPGWNHRDVTMFPAITIFAWSNHHVCCLDHHLCLVRSPSLPEKTHPPLRSQAVNARGDVMLHHLLGSGSYWGDLVTRRVHVT